MPNPGDEVILTTEGLAVSNTLPTGGDQGFQFTEDLGRGSSGSPSQDDTVVLSTPDVALAGGALTPDGDFAVNIIQTNSPVKETDVLSVTAEITNNLSEEQSGNIVLSIDGDPIDNQSITFSAGETSEVTLTWETSETDAGTYTAKVESETDSDTASVEVLEVNKRGSGDFSLTITETNEPVAEGAVAVVTLDIHNELFEVQSGNIVLYVNDTYVDNVEVTVAAGETYTLSLLWEDTEGFVGDNPASVESGTDQVSEPITVETYDGKAYKVTTTANVSDRQSSQWVYTEVEAVRDNTRLIECSLSFQQEGTFHSDDASVALEIANSLPGNQDFDADQTIYVPEGNGRGTTAVFDLGSEQSGNLYLAADDGDSAIAPP